MSFFCPSILWHGPGSQSKTRCERKDPHPVGDRDDEPNHYARMMPSLEWSGANELAEVRPLHSDLDMQARCDGECAHDECVCKPPLRTLMCNGCHGVVDPSKGMLVWCDACTATSLQHALIAKQDKTAELVRALRAIHGDVVPLPNHPTVEEYVTMIFKWLPGGVEHGRESVEG